MAVTYGLSEEILTLGHEHRISYGIVVYAHANAEGTATIIASARDLSPTKQKVENLVYMCNRMKLSPIHFDDIIDDFLAE